jgi:hypothetical protein
MTTPNDAARPYGWLIRKGASDMWAYCDTEEDADFYGKQSGLKYEKLALYTAADYDALLADRDCWEQQAGERLKDWAELRAEVGSWRARAEAAEAKVAKIGEAAKRARTMIDHHIHGEPGTSLETAFDALTAALNEGDGDVSRI